MKKSGIIAVIVSIIVVVIAIVVGINFTMNATAEEPSTTESYKYAVMEDVKLIDEACTDYLVAYLTAYYAD